MVVTLDADSIGGDIAGISLRRFLYRPRDGRTFGVARAHSVQVTYVSE
jgi:hypothetical protein